MVSWYGQAGFNRRWAS